MQPLRISRTVADIPELLHQVVDELDASGDRQTLARLAQTSSPFHQISIARLWARVGGKKPKDCGLRFLLRLLPEGLLDISKYVRGVPAFTRTPTSQDWNRFRHYSVHTVSLLFHVVPDVTLSPLLEAHQSYMLFPRLQTVTVYTTYGNGWPFSEWMRIAGSSLHDLSMVTKFNGDRGGGEEDVEFDNLMAFLSHLRDRASNLQHLCLTKFPDLTQSSSAASSEALATTLQALPRLKTLIYTSGCTPPNAVLCTIATHPSLVNIKLDPIDDWPMVLTGKPPYFTSLQRVSISFDEETAGGAFVQSLSYPHRIDTFEIASGLSETEPSDTAAFHAFQPFSNLFQLTTNITSVTLTCSWILISWSQLQPLLNCKSMSLFRIRTNTPLAGFNNEAVRDLALAWPHLEHLYLFRLCSLGYSPPEVSLHGLIPLAQFPHKLQNMRMTFTTQGLSQHQLDELMRFHPAIPSPLDAFNVQDSEINLMDNSSTFLGPEQTSNILKRLWPSLRSTSAASWTRYGPIWASVNAHLNTPDTR